MMKTVNSLNKQKQVNNENLKEAMSGYVYTYCDNCGEKNRVKVNFPDSGKGFTTTYYRCSACGVKNELYDEMQEGILDVTPLVKNIKHLSETECDEGVGTAVVKGGKYAWKAIKFCVSHITEIATALQALGMSADEIKKILDTFKSAKLDNEEEEPMTEVLPAAVVTGAKVLGTAAASLAAEKGLEKVSDLLGKNAENVKMKENYSVKSALDVLQTLDE